MKDFKWKSSNYKQMMGKWKIGIILEAGYKECDNLDDYSNLIKLTEKIYFQNNLLPYPESVQMLQEELEYWYKGIALVSREIEYSKVTTPYLIVTLHYIHYSMCDIQNEAFTASAIQWASEMFGFIMPDIRVFFDSSLNPPYGKYVYGFSAKVVFDVFNSEHNLEYYEKQYSKFQICNDELLIAGRLCENIKCGDILYTTDNKPIKVKKILSYGHIFEELDAGMTGLLIIEKLEHNFEQFEKLYDDVCNRE